MVKGKKASLFQRVFMGIGRYVALGSVMGASTNLTGCFCPNYKPIPEDITKQKYLYEGPFNYAAELDCKCREYSKQGKILEDLLTRGAWTLAVLNGAGKAVTSGGLEVVAGENGKNFALYVFDGTYGGRTFNEVIL